MGQVSLNGSLTAGPQTAGSDFPSSTVAIALQLLTEPKSSGVASGVISRQVASPSPAWLTLQGVGEDDTVTKGDTLYVRCSSALLLRLTTDDGSGGDVLAGPVPVQGTLLLEFQPSTFLKKLEVQGTGQIEYFISGQQ